MRWIFSILFFVALVIAPATASVPDPGAEPAGPLVASFAADPSSGSAPLEVHFTDTSTGSPTSWLWDFGDGTTSTERHPVHTYHGLGRYRVTLFAERAEPHGVASVTGEVIVLVGDEVTADYTANTTSGPAPLAVQFTDLSSGATGWSWTFGDGGTSTDQNPSHVYTVPGTYTVSLRAQNAYRMDTETKVGYISVTGPVNASFTATPRAVPVGAPVQFTDTSTGNPCTFAWEFGDGATSTERNPSHAYGAPGDYTVSLTAANPLHSDTRTETGYIVVNDQVDARFDANVTGGTVPLTVHFTDRSTGSPTSWTWDFGDGGSSTVQHPVHTYIAPGTCDVTLTVSNGHTSHRSTALNCILVVYQSPAVVAVPGIAGPPADTDGDGLCEDLNANGRPDFADVVLFFDQMGWIAANEPVGLFDYNRNGAIDFGDVVRLFDRACVVPASTPVQTPGPTPVPGTAIFLNKTVGPGCEGGHIVDGTTIEGEARSGDWVTINGQRYQFRNGEQFRFTVRGNQTEGQVFIEQCELRTLSFNVEFEVRNLGTTEWKTPQGFSTQTGNLTVPINVGVPLSISISAINKNLLNDASTLTYRSPVSAPSDTRLVIDGRTMIDARDPPGDATYLEFAGLHGVHETQSGEGLDTMWICLMPGYDYLLVQGDCISP